MAMLRFAGYGPTTPPFTVASPPPIRQMLEVRDVAWMLVLDGVGMFS